MGAMGKTRRRVAVEALAFLGAALTSSVDATKNFAKQGSPSLNFLACASQPSRYSEFMPNKALGLVVLQRHFHPFNVALPSPCRAEYLYSLYVRHVLFVAPHA